MKQTDPQYKLRLPQELKDALEKATEVSGRSLNAEIVARLQDSLRGVHEENLPPPIRSLVDMKCDETGKPEDQVIAEALLAGLDPGAKPVFYFHVHADATIDQLIAVYEAAKKILEPEGLIYVQHDHPVPKARPLSRKKA